MSPRHAPATRVGPVALAALVVALVLALAGCGGEDATSADHNDADVAFVQGMIPHHEQAVEMVAMTEDRDLDVELVTLAEDIRTAQSGELEQLRQWQQAWSEESSGAGGMGMGGDMGGMMSGAQLDELAQAADGSFRRLWLQSMIEHHQGALAMAESEIQDGLAPDVVTLARSMRDAQQAEITRMQALLAG